MAPGSRDGASVRDVRCARRRAVEHVGRDRRRADREDLPPGRGGREPRARAAALLRHARLRERAEALGLVVVRGLADERARSGWCRSSSPARSTAGRSRSRSSPADPAAFLGRTRRLGEVIGEMHAVLASEPDDPAFSPEEREPGVARAAHGHRRRGDRATSSCTLPENDATAPIVGRGDAMRVAAARALDRRLGRQAHPPPRRPPPRADALGRTATGS